MKVIEVKNGSSSFKFLLASKTCEWRARSLATKEPHTLRWTMAIPKGAVYFDVGANVGSYTIPAASIDSVTVVAFEPEASNYAILNGNISLNGAEQSATAYCVGVSDTNGFSQLFIHGKDAGGSMNSVAENLRHDLKPRSGGRAQGCYQTTIDTFLASGAAPHPTHLKVDVDGIEHRVINGALGLLANKTLQGLCVETNFNLEEHRSMNDAIKSAGFTYDEAQVNAAMRQDGPFKNTAEVIWSRNT